MNDMHNAESQDIETLTDEQLENVDGGDIWGNLFGQLFAGTATGFGVIFGGGGGFKFP